MKITPLPPIVSVRPVIEQFELVKTFDVFGAEKNYSVKAFRLKPPVSLEDCLKHLAVQRAVLLGNEGTKLVWEWAKEDLPQGFMCFSLPEKDAFWETYIKYLRCVIAQTEKQGGGFALGDELKQPLNEFHCLLCFFEKD
jgi:hypothetical protein